MPHACGMSFDRRPDTTKRKNYLGEQCASTLFLHVSVCVDYAGRGRIVGIRAKF
jgi:hypothetical protein